MNAEDLRMFALRRAVAENQHQQQQGRQQHQQLVIRVENNSQDCQLHSNNDTTSNQQRHLSRKEMARELRLLAAKQEKEAREVRQSNQNSCRRSSSFSPGAWVKPNPAEEISHQCSHRRRLDRSGAAQTVQVQSQGCFKEMFWTSLAD